MKRIALLVAVILLITISGFSQVYTTGQTDYWGNTSTTVKDVYGNTTGSAVTGQTDYWGNTKTTFKEKYGNTTGTATTGQTDYWGNTTTTVRDQYGNI